MLFRELIREPTANRIYWVDDRNVLHWVLTFKAITALPQPTAFSAQIHGHEGECPCCWRRFADA